LAFQHLLKIKLNGIDIGVLFRFLPAIAFIPSNKYDLISSSLIASDFFGNKKPDQLQ
jgi:hypothetical protein